MVCNPIDVCLIQRGVSDLRCGIVVLQQNRSLDISIRETCFERFSFS